MYLRFFFLSFLIIILSFSHYSFVFFFLMIRRPPRSTLSSSSAASDVYKRQAGNHLVWPYDGHGAVVAGLPSPAGPNDVQAGACPAKKKCKPCPDGCDKKPGHCVGNYFCSVEGRNHKLHDNVNVTRDWILKRAVGWLVNTFHYMDTMCTETCSGKEPYACPGYGWLADCIGFVHMAWQYNPGSARSGNMTADHETLIQEGVSNGAFYPVPMLNCSTADWVSTGGHSMLFIEWAGGAKAPKKFLKVWQMGGTRGKVNIDTVLRGLHYKCFRRSGVEIDRS
eukprot:TRINITY_DN36934_c0_g2_i1.p1 TRINITY_DN36934_c0_g2~~TRINITY_DN36934_c0_g2_i1.p1  ORF type:complete len:280 (+),score=29.61 TRINITY_DN36934_c0_g2_i1:11-850(+)